MNTRPSDRPEMPCDQCRHARRTAIHELAPLPKGRYRCAHPVTRMACALISTENPEKHPAARHLIKLEGPWNQKGMKKVFRWPWEYCPMWIEACRGFER